MKTIACIAAEKAARCVLIRHAQNSYSIIFYLQIFCNSPPHERD